MICDKHCLPLIPFSDADIVVSLSKINAGEEFCSLYFGNHITKFTKKSWGMIRVDHVHLGYHAGNVIDLQSDPILVGI